MAATRTNKARKVAKPVPAVRKKAAARAKSRAAKPAKSSKPAKRKPAINKRKAALPARKKSSATKSNSRTAKPATRKKTTDNKERPKVSFVSELDTMPPMTKAYMSPTQREWFRKRLESILEEIQHEAENTAKTLREQEKVHADEFDRAHSEFAYVVDLRENERISNLQVKINHALRQLEEATYGYCDDCGVEIGIQRMVARPVATKCIDCKQFQENLEKHAI